MTTRRKLTIGPIGEDVDLTTDDARLANGARLTDDAAAELAEAALARRRGRPSLTAPGQRTPKLTLRVTEDTRTALEAIAEHQGRRLADVGRDAFDEYIERHATG